MAAALFGSTPLPSAGISATRERWKSVQGGSYLMILGCITTRRRGYGIGDIVIRLEIYHRRVQSLIGAVVAMRAVLI